MANVSEGTASFLHGLSDLWIRFFKDIDQIKALEKGLEISVGQAYLDLMATVLNFSIRETPVFQKEFFKLLTIREDLFTERGDERYEIELTDIAIKSFDFLYNKIFDPTVILESLVDFEMDISGAKDILIFEKNLFDWNDDGSNTIIPGVAYRTLEVEDDEGTITEQRELAFWIPDAQYDAFDMYLNYGHLIAKFEPSSEAYRALIRGIMRYFMLGPTPRNLTSALNVIVGLPVIRDDGEILQEVTTSISGDNTVVTDARSYTFDPSIPLRPDVLDTSNWGTLSFRAFEKLTSVFKIYDTLEKAHWWFDKTILKKVLPDEPEERRRINPELYENKIGKPDGLVKIGDPGFFIGADEDGYVPEVKSGYPEYIDSTGYNWHLWRPPYRHTMSWVVFERFLRHHSFVLEFDDDVLLSGNLPFSRLEFDLESIIQVGKSAYVFMHTEPSLSFVDGVHITDYIAQLKWLLALDTDVLEGYDNSIKIGSTILIGDYYSYTPSGITVSHAPWPGPLPDASGNTPVVIGGPDPTDFVDGQPQAHGDWPLQLTVT